jgi:hypothetical protein
LGRKTASLGYRHKYPQSVAGEGAGGKSEKKIKITTRTTRCTRTTGQLKKLDPNYALEAERTNALVGFNPGLATLGFHQKAFLDVVKTLVLLGRCEAEKMLLHFLDENSNPHVRFISREPPDSNNIFKFSQTAYLRKLFETRWNRRNCENCSSL